MRTIGLSPKLIAAALTSVVTFALTKLALPWNPIYEQLINALAPIIAAYLAPAGAVGDTTGVPSDDLLTDAAKKKLA